ncbi:MAG: mandelate racemase/muconate lactonizing enzyme family protein [Candidatus Hydrogenedentes bacterium]|nr:mandelate racemase/muconate lactonizing enzyme family protein [Candidatus Hydrogenedentota bacterium]
MQQKQTDIRVVRAELYLLPIQTRVPLKFGNETLTHVTVARARVRVENRKGTVAEGWGETPLSVQWVWPSAVAYETRHEALKAFCVSLAKAWASFEACGHPMTVGAAFQAGPLHDLWREYNATHDHAMPWLAALVCCSLFDIAVHDAYGNSLNLPTYATYNADFMNCDLSAFLEGDASVSFAKKHPQDFFVQQCVQRLPAWHLVGGKDPIDESELDGSEPNDGYPVLLRDWIARDGLKCLKVKLRGNDAAWDYDRLMGVGDIAAEMDADWLSADFNCTVTDPAYVNEILDRLMIESPRVYGMLLYVEQPFPYELEEHRIDVHSVSARKPLFMDESAHDWKLVRLGRELGWTGVALKTCKTQTGALLSLCWAKAHGMTLMVQDLTNPMLAQIPHVLLAAHAGTIMGVETNAMQFYPEASNAEAKVHPGLYTRRKGRVDFASVSGPGFGYRATEINRPLPGSIILTGV